MTKDEVQKMFSAYFQGRKAIYDYFGVEGIETYNYELQWQASNWMLVGFKENGYGGDKLHWAIPTDIEEPEGTYQFLVHGVFRKEYHTLIFGPSSTGDAGFAMIFDNEKELRDG